MMTRERIWELKESLEQDFIIHSFEDDFSSMFIFEWDNKPTKNGGVNSIIDIDKILLKLLRET